MRQHAGSVNRVWLAVVGMALLLTGVTGTLATTGALTSIFAAAGVPATGPRSGTTLVEGVPVTLLDQPLGAVALGVLGLLLGVLGLAWLLAQIPRTNAARSFRLHDESTGLTVCEPGVLADAVAREVRSYPGVNNAAAVIRGTASAPELTVRLAADYRTDLRSLLDAIEQEAAANLARALDAPLAQLAVQLDIDRGRRATKEALS